MAHYRMALVGFGNVGKAFVRLLNQKSDELENQFGVTWSITGIATGHHGMAIDPNGIDIHSAIRQVESGLLLNQISKVAPLNDVYQFMDIVPADVLFENSPVNYQTGQPAVDHLRIGFTRGMHGVTANKGPVVHAYHELSRLAQKMDKHFYFESTVMDGAPIFSLFRETLPGASLLSIRGILNSTTNLILGQMETGETFDQAVAYAQKIGIAETDPSGDIDGWDAAVKLAALATVMMDTSLKPDQIDRKGIRNINNKMIWEARDAGMRWKLVCTAKREGDSVNAKVAPEMVPSSSALYQVNGTSSMVQFETDVLGLLTVIEQDPGPETTAYGLLADFLNAIR